jgi:hypothetical protein
MIPEVHPCGDASFLTSPLIPWSASARRTRAADQPCPFAATPASARRRPSTRAACRRPRREKVRGIFDRDMLAWRATSPRRASSAAARCSHTSVVVSSDDSHGTVLRRFSPAGTTACLVDTLHGTGDPDDRVELGATRRHRRGFSRARSIRIAWSTDLGSNVTTTGCACASQRSAADISVGEVEAFADLVGHRTLSRSPAQPTAVTAARPTAARVPSVRHQ